MYERGIWSKHEDHVKDNQDTVRKIHKQIKVHPKLRAGFYAQEWQVYTASTFTKHQRNTQKIIGSIFNSLVVKAVIIRNTKAEYISIRKKIAQTCT